VVQKDALLRRANIKEKIIARAMVKDNYVLIASLDLSAAFDVVDV
jgi:hypothetical protein